MESGKRRIGVEEEFLLVDSQTSKPLPKIEAVLPEASRLAGDQAQKELHQAQIEAVTPPCLELEELGTELAGLRAKVSAAAAEHGATVVSSGTYPGMMGTSGRLITEGERYESMLSTAPLLAREHLICGCHIHVSVEDRETAVQVMNRMRRWSACLLAMAANSPFWEGQDTGFASFRTEVWTRWPTAGPTGEFASYEEYSSLLDRLISAGVILDRAMAYWDIRPSERYPTLEFRITDVMLDVEDTLAVAGLVRALVEHFAGDEAPATPLRPELLRAASWNAARTGLSGELLDPLDGRSAPAEAVIDRLLDVLRPALGRLGDAEQVERLTAELVHRGDGAARQRGTFAGRHRMEDVLSLASV